MEDFKIALSRRVLAKYDELIEALQEIYEDDKDFALTVYGNAITPEVQLRMQQAKANLDHLERVKAEREHWLEKYPIPE